MLKFDRYLCLISDHMGASCRACIESCYAGAFSVKGGRIRFEEKLCTGCGGCVGGCPAEAMALEGFDEDHFALVFAQANQTRLSCKENTPCLAVFDAEHLAVMVLRSKRSIECDLSHCAACESNSQNRLLTRIQTRIDHTNDLLIQLGAKERIETRAQSADPLRRGFFKKLLSGAAQAAVTPETAHKPVDTAVTPVPKGRILLQNTLRDYPAQTLLALNSPLIAGRAVNDACTACGECVRICPTRALSWETNGAALLLENRRCIDCDLCGTVCKTAAIFRPEKTDAAAYAGFDKTALIRFAFRECDTCGTPFAAAPGVTTCRPCADYAQDFGNMFTPAWQTDGT